MRKQKVLLLADDVRVFLELYCPFLQRKGIEVLTASDGEQALALIREKHPDIAILDYFMPELTGAEVCQKVKADPALNHIPVLIITSENRPAVVDKCRAAGCEEIVFKPIAPEVFLQRALRRLALPVRQHPRVSIQLGCIGEWRKETFTGQTLDLSEGGVLLETDIPLKVGAPVSISFHLPPSDEKIAAEGEVVREADAEAGHRYGVQFVSFAEGERRAIGQFVQSHLQEETKA